MDTRSYWHASLERRIGRRSAMAGAGLSAASLVFLAACGGDSGNDKKAGSESKGGGLLAPAVATTDKAVKGGTAVFRVTANPINLDLNGSGGNVDVRSAGEMSYRQLLVWDHGTLDHPPEGKVLGDAFEAWEVAPGGARITVKLRSQKFDPRAPT